jgi:hypothetical protein
MKPTNTRKLLAAVAVSTVGAAAAIGCNALLDINAPNVVEDAGGDRAIVDGSVADSSVVDGSVVDSSVVDGSVDDSSVDAGENLVSNPSFVNGCGDWSGDGAEVSAVDSGHTDGHACRVCFSGTTFFGINRITIGNAVVKVNDSFYAEAWVRKDPDRDAAPEMSLEIEIDIDSESNTIQQKQVGTANIQITDDWVPMAGPFTVTAADAGEANVVFLDVLSRIGDATGHDRCFVVDDVVFRRGSN